MSHNLDGALKTIIRAVMEGRKLARDELSLEGVSQEMVEDILSAQEALITGMRLERRGLFIVVSGPDKSGKETQAFNTHGRAGIVSIYDFLSREGYRVKKVLQPSYETKLGGLVARYLGKVGSKIEASRELAWILWSLDRAQHNREVVEWLRDEGNVVLAKRWSESNLVYQSVLGVKEADLLKVERNIAKQDLTLVLDIYPETFLKRLDGEGADDYEEVDLIRRVREKYLNLPTLLDHGAYIYIDANSKETEVNKIIAGVLGQWLKNKQTS